MSKINFSIINRYDDMINPNNSYYIPEFKEIYSKEWVPFGTSTNEYAKNLIELAYNSSLHGTIIQNKTNMIAGEYFEEPTDAATKAFMEEPNKYENLHKILYKCAYDLTMYGSFILEVIWNRDKTRILELYHVDVSKVLYAKRNEKGYIVNYFFCDDWEQYRKSNYPVEIIPRFKTSEERRELLVSIPAYQSGFLYYTYPDYQQGFRAIEIDAKIMEFHKANLDNNFESGKMITFFGDEPTEEEKQINRELFEDSYTGAANGGATVINYSLDDKTAPKIQTINDDGNGDKFLTLRDNAIQGIITAHGITSPLLVGISVPGSLGGGAELEIAQELFFIHRILPKRKSIMIEINKLLAINGLQPVEVVDNKASIGDTMSQNITINHGNTNN